MLIVNADVNVHVTVYLSSNFDVDTDAHLLSATYKLHDELKRAGFEHHHYRPVLGSSDLPHTAQDPVGLVGCRGGEQRHPVGAGVHHCRLRNNGAGGRVHRRLPRRYLLLLVFQLAPEDSSKNTQRLGWDGEHEAF